MEKEADWEKFLKNIDKKNAKKLKGIAEALNASVSILESYQNGRKQKKPVIKDAKCPYCHEEKLFVLGSIYDCRNCKMEGDTEELEVLLGISDNPNIVEHVYYRTDSLYPQAVLKIRHNSKLKKRKNKYYEIHNNKWREEKILRVAALYNAPLLGQTRTVLFVDSEIDADILNQKIKEEKINHALAITNAGGIANRAKGDFERQLKAKNIYIVLSKTVDDSFTAQHHALFIFNTVDAKTRENTKIIDPGLDDNESLVKFLERKHLSVRRFLESCKNQREKIPTTRFWQEIINPSYKEGTNNRTDSQVILDRLKERYDIRFNLAIQLAEYKTKYAEKYIPMEEREINTMIMDYETEYTKPTLTDKLFLRIVNSYYIPSINPFQEYYESLPPWDGKTDHIMNLSETVEFDEVTEFPRFYWALKMYLVGVIATSMGERSLDMGLFFADDGGQGKGKTTWLNNLSPDNLKRYHSIGRINFLDKNSYINLSGNIFIQLDEFDQYTKIESSIIKNFMTQRYVNFRQPYGKRLSFYPRLASFLGSLNKTKFLTDESGNRRYLVFVVSKFLNKGNHNYNMDLVYAQAFALWQKGERYWLNADEIEELNEYNKRFIIGSMEEELIINYLRPANESDEESKIKKLQTFNIVELLINKTNMDVDPKKVSKALYRLGYQKKSIRINSQPRKIWEVIEL